jgi:hypothetical protein
VIGAAINGHIGFALTPLLFCTALIVLPTVHWLVGVAATPGVLPATWVFLLPIHDALGVLGKRKSNGSL